MDQIVHEETRARIARTATTMGIVSLAIVILVPSLDFFGMMLGAFSLLLSFLSKGKRKAYDKIAILTASVAIAMSVISIGSMIFKLSTDKEYREARLDEITSVYSEMYGPEYAEYVEEMRSYFDNILGE